MRILGTLLIISAVIVFFWNDIKEIMTDRINERMIEAFHNGEESISINSVESFITDMDLSNGDDDSLNNNMIGYLNIESAGINEPIFDGPVTEDNLRKGVSLVDETDHLNMQNVAIAGHRVEGAGIRFNYLDEASVGDIIELVTNESAKTFEITEIFNVNPSQVEVLDQNDNQPQEMSLITCDVYNPETLLFEERMIVKAEIVN